jgi:hypothetical protein
MEIVALIAGIIKAIPILDKWFTNIYSAYITATLDSIDDKVKAQKEEMQFLTLKMQGAANNEERKIAFRLICKFSVK